MVKKIGEDNKPIEPKPKQSRRRYVRKLNPKLPKLDVKDFLPKLRGKTGVDLKREVMKIRETLESEYNELKKKVSERKQKALEALSVKSTETLKKEEIKKEKADVVKLDKADEIKQATVQAVLEYIDTQKTPTQILNDVASYKDATQENRANFNRKLKTYSKDKAVLGAYVRRFREAPLSKQKELMEDVEPLTQLTVVKMTAAEKAAEGSQKLENLGITVKKKPSVKTPVKPPVVLGMLPFAQSGAEALGDPSDTDSEGDLGGAGFAKIKKHAKEHNIALLGKEEMLRLGDESISLKRQISQLNELKRNRSVVIRRSDLIDAERPINYELSIL